MLAPDLEKRGEIRYDRVMGDDSHQARGWLKRYVVCDRRGRAGRDY